MTKNTLEKHLGRYVCIHLEGGSVRFGILEKYLPQKDGFCHAREYILRSRNGDVTRFRAADVRKISESRRNGQG